MLFKRYTVVDQNQGSHSRWIHRQLKNGLERLSVGTDNLTPDGIVLRYLDTTAVVVSSDPQLKERSSDRQLNKSVPDLLSLQDTLITVRGRVVDEKGEPLNGVTVMVKETSKATSTDGNGFFTIMARKGDVLEFSYVGYEAVESKVKETENSVFINLKPSVSKLEEVNVTVNTGYQEFPKERATGSFVKVDKELFNRRVSTDVIDRIEGIASGVFFDLEVFIVRC